ncbi:MAG TPA: LLM class flavin-dependent oxidoreductase [Actinomycetota bacterium]|nr:LLM class flavin-dependent oxidoreductase [Actinomycetota bacterium]
MRFGLKTNQQHLGWPELLGRVRLAEEHGFENVWIFDHLKAMGGDPDGDCMEAWTLLAALAASTERIRIGAMVTGVMFRHPSVLAAQALTVDHVSNGRLDLAMGAGSFEEEHRELGIDYPADRERAERLEEAVRVLRLLMTTDGATSDGAYYRLDGATYRPRPVQRPHPPVWVGAGGDRVTIPIAARQADVWHCFNDFDELPHKLEVFADAARAAGRDPGTVRLATNLSIDDGWDDVAERTRALGALGITELVVPWPAGGEERALEFAHRVMPGLLAA